jgi:hypothetical protein
MRASLRADQTNRMAIQHSHQRHPQWIPLKIYERFKPWCVCNSGRLLRRLCRAVLHLPKSHGVYSGTGTHRQQRRHKKEKETKNVLPVDLLLQHNDADSITDSLSTRSQSILAPLYKNVCRNPAAFLVGV